MTDEVSWNSLVQMGKLYRQGQAARGTLLEFMLAIGDMGLYRGFDADGAARTAAMLDLVVAMEPRHCKAIASKFAAMAKNMKIATLGIPADFMEPALVDLLWCRAGPLLSVERPGLGSARARRAP